MTDKKHPGGRPTRYKKEFAEQAYKMCKLGAIDKDLADFFKVAESTLNKWKLDHPEFSESIQRGKAYPDEQVEKALFQRAIGYQHPDTYFSNFQGRVTETETVKHYPPDTAAAFIWLKNRKPEQWRDKKEIEISEIEIGKPPALDEAEFPEE